MSLAPKRNRQPYIPPNQRSANATCEPIRWLRRSWAKWGLLTRKLVSGRPTWPRVIENLRRLRLSKNDPALNAKVAWQELDTARAALKATTDATRRDFGDLVQLKAMQTNLQSSADQSKTAGIDGHVCKLLQMFLAHHSELTEKLNAVNRAAVTAAERSRRLVRLYEQTAKLHSPQSTWHTGYLQFAADCSADADSAVELAQKTAARRTRLHLLMSDATAIVRFFVELRLHRERTSPLNSTPDAYRLQLAHAVDLCWQAIDFLEP